MTSNFSRHIELRAHVFDEDRNEDMRAVAAIMNSKFERTPFASMNLTTLCTWRSSTKTFIVKCKFFKCNVSCGFMSRFINALMEYDCGPNGLAYCLTKRIIELVKRTAKRDAILLVALNGIRPTETNEQLIKEINAMRTAQELSKDA